ncbi:MAG: class I SAM-dependent methyltransferase [Magnetospirillum sp. WYHS-4]
MSPFPHQDSDVHLSQREFFDKHPFPGLHLPEDVTRAQFINILEKNHLYRCIRGLLFPGCRLLDAGCGTGEFTAYLSMGTDAEVIGIDYSQATIAWARNLATKVPGLGRVDFREADVFALSNEYRGNFDVVLAMGLFPSIPREQEGLRNLVDTLKPGGIAIFGFFDPVGRAYLRLKRWLLQASARCFADQEAIVRKAMMAHVKDENLVRWQINQLTEEFLNFHSPRRAWSMMAEAGLSVTDCFPSCQALGGIYPEALEVKEAMAKPFPTLGGQMRWLMEGTDGYFVLAGRKGG